MDKQHILNEIRRTAEQNGGKPLGRARFKAETGITESDWYAKHWRTWGEAVVEAGYRPNELQSAFDDELIIQRLIEFVREIGRYPVAADLRMRARSDPGFPSHTVFGRLGKKADVAQKVIKFCQSSDGLEDVIRVCEPIAASGNAGIKTEPIEPDETEFGHVYLMKSGGFYKIGRTNSIGRREYELGIQLPEKATTVHTIKTDDAVGIEEYWHKRFADKRMNGEWFKLLPSDVKAFKRRRFM